MGVGVYSNTFNGRGDTFLVSGDLTSYEEYVTAAKREGLADEDIDSELGFYNQRGEDDIEALKAALAITAKDLGLYPQDDRNTWEEDFLVYAADGNHMTLGHRGWEHDSVVGAWCPEGYGDDYALDAGNAYEHSRDGWKSHKMLNDNYLKMAELTLEHARLAVQSLGLEARFRTSGYTTGKFAVLSEAENAARRREILLEYNVLRTANERPYHLALFDQTAEQWVHVLQARHDQAEHYPIGIPAYHAASDSLVWLDPNHLEDGPLDTEAWPDALIRPTDAHGELTLLTHDEALATADDPLMRLCVERSTTSRDRFYAPAALWEAATREDIDLDEVPAFDSPSP